MALDAAMNTSANVGSAAQPSAQPSTAFRSDGSPQPQAPPRLLIRLLPQSSDDGRRSPLKRKWRSFVNFFALPIRAYYMEPPGLNYRAQLRARRPHVWADTQPHHSFLPCPAYTDQVGDDEMVLFKAQEEAQVLAAMQRDQTAIAQREQEQEHDQSSPELDHSFSDEDDNEDEEEESEEEEQLASATLWTSLPSETRAAFDSPVLAEPSPQYEVADPLAAVTFPSRPVAPRRPRTSSNLTPFTEPSFANGIAMSRQHSTPLATPSPRPSSSHSSSSAGGIFPRRNRAQTNASHSSLSSRNISEPLSWTLVRSQYSYPKRGLTAEQLSFLSSVESLGRFGVPHSPSGSAVVEPSPAYESGAAQDYGFPSMQDRA